MATTYLSKTLSTATSNGIIGTFSFWVKLCGIRTDGNDYMLFSSYADGNNRMHIKIDGSNTLDINSRIGGAVHLSKITNRKFRDTSAWYSIIVAIDTSQGTAADGCKVYINGVQETSFATDTNPSQNQKIHALENSKVHYWGSYGGAPTNSVYALDGLMSHINFIDGTQAAPTVFGSTDSVTGEWKISTSPSVTYGNNGYFILKDGNSVTDQSGNSNNFTVGNGTLTNTEDCPSNVFATLNPLYQQTTGEGVVLMNGNTRCYYNPDSSRSAFGTIAVGTGKYYYEAECETAGTGPVVGVVDLAWGGINGAAGAFHDNALNFGYSSSGVKTSGGVNTAYGDTFTTGDIIGVAIDKTNNKLYFAKNGVWQNSGDPTSGATGTGSAFNLASDTLYTSACRMRNGGDWKFNFGNGYFGTTAISSEGTNASGNGKFEYDVPTGYTALSTKGLNE